MLILLRILKTFELGFYAHQKSLRSMIYDNNNNNMAKGKRTAIF